MPAKQPAVRLTLFALLSAIEVDLRSLIRAHIIRNPFVPEPFTTEQRQKLHDRLGRQNNDKVDNPTSDYLVDYLDFAEAGELLLRHSASFSHITGAAFVELLPSIVKLAPIRNRVMHSRPFEPDDFSAVYDVVNSAKRDDALWHDLAITVQRLAQEPEFVLQLKIPEIAWDIVPDISNNLPLPEFDDTGFVGRADDCVEVKKLILGHHQFITIIGEGGVGKTALLVKCLNDLRSEATEKFDCILWVSLKNQVLTVGGVEGIKNAASSLMGMLSALNAAAPAGGSKNLTFENARDELLLFFQEFRVLLAIDNLESIQNEDIRVFLRAIPPPTKVVITSRVGLGELEVRRPLNALLEGEAVQLFRRYAQLGKVDSLMKLSQRDITQICKRLYLNPLIIKWFVNSVQLGNPAESVLRKQRDVLAFCFKNVYEKLSSNAHLLLKALAAAKVPLGDAELAYLADVSPASMRQHLYEIVATMMVRQSHQRLSDGTLETKYGLSDIARKYMDEFHRPDSSLNSKVTTKLQMLTAASEEASQARNLNPYLPYAISIRTANDRVPALMLQKALRASKAQRFEEALALVEQARDTAPGYSEVYKIGAFIKASSGDITGAREDYEQALQCTPDSAPIILFYAGFCLRHLQDVPLALELTERAHKLDPNERNIQVMKARALTFSGRLADARTIFESVIPKFSDEQARWRLKVIDMAVDMYRRTIEAENTAREFRRAIDASVAARSLLDGVFASGIRDDHLDMRACEVMRASLGAYWKTDLTDGFGELVRFLRTYSGRMARDEHFADLIHDVVRLSQRAVLDEDLSQWLDEVSRQFGVPEHEKLHVGKVVNVVKEKNFGFIVSDIDGGRYYFRCADFSSSDSLRTIEVGSVFRFRLVANDKGPRAVPLTEPARTRSTASSQRNPRASETGDSDQKV